jgi:hypothetical protein
VRASRFAVEIRDLPSTDNPVQDDDKIRGIDETQSLQTEDIITITDNDEAHLVPTEDTIIINDNNDTDPIATVYIITHLTTSKRPKQIHQAIIHTKR